MTGGCSPDGSGSRASHEAATASSPKASIPNALGDFDLLAEINSERVISACDWAKAVPGDVWGQGGEGHYAFLCGLAAMLNMPGMVDEMIEQSRKRQEWWEREYPETHISRRCPTRVLYDLGFTAQGIEAQRAETLGSVHESPVAESDAPKGDQHD